ncbi:unnamed protein product [Allacma fusca]|uniref:Uncharacterized protein n=1 Tax=Allacma fusca TaxID=39272 RepID=A0A8J2JWW5_9HEXA|nr:unnamed protein product [Allacma fusca]
MSDFPESEDTEKDEIRRQFDTYCETIQSNKSTLDDKTAAVQKGWAQLLENYVERRTKDFPVLFDRLYLATAKLILGGEWYMAITENNYKNGDVLKNGLGKSLDALIAEVSIEYPMECKFCLNLKPLLDRSPWSLSYITDIITPNHGSDHSAVEQLWKEENETLVDVRLELLCSTKEYQKAFSIAFACYQEMERSQQSLEDRVSDSSGNFKNEQLRKRKFFNQELTNFFYLLLCVNVCRNKSVSDMDKFFSVSTAVEVVSYLSDISPSRQRLASKWKEWKKACKTIISTTTDFFIKHQLEDIDVDLTRRVFTYWIKHAAKNEEDIRPAKDLLDQINQINTDLIYTFADVLYEDFKSRSNAVQKTIELYFRAMSKDINQIEKLDVTDNQADKKQLLKNKLASRYLRLAKLFACDEKVSWELTLTAFSLSPSEDLFKHLFSQQPTSSTSKPDPPIFELSPALKEDLQTVIANPRWKSLCWVKDKIELEQLCRQQLDTGGPKIKAKEDLIHLHIDYEKYEPRQEYFDENDFGFEKGYEPKNFNMFGEPRRKKKREKSLLLKKALPRRKPFPTAFNKQGKKKIFGVTQSTSTNQPKMHGISKGIAKKLSDIKQMRIIKQQSQPNNQESFQELQTDILRLKRFGRKTPRFSQLYTQKYVLNLDSHLKHLHFPRCLSDAGEAEGEEPKVSVSFSRFTGNQACAGNELEKVNMSSLNSNDFNSKYLLGLETVTTTLEDQIQPQANQVVCSEQLVRLCSEKYPDSFTLQPCLFTKSVDPLVTLENLIPLDFVQSSATNLAFNYIIQVMNKSLDAFWGACHNPAMSEAFKAAIENQVDQPIPNPEETIPRIISEVCQHNGTHATPEGLTGAASIFSISAPRKPIKKQVGPKRTTNRRYAQRLIARASSTMSQNIALKRQALGLEFIHGKLIRASMLSDTSVNFQSVSTIIKEASNSVYAEELKVPPACPSISKFQFHRFEDFIIAQAEMSERTMLVTSATDLPISQHQAASVSEVNLAFELNPGEETKDANISTSGVPTNDNQTVAYVSACNAIVSESLITQNISTSVLSENVQEPGAALSGEQISSQEQARTSVPLVCSIVKLIYGDCVRNKVSPYLPQSMESAQESEPEVNDVVEENNDANDSDFTPSISPPSPISPFPSVLSKKRSSVGGKNRPKPKRFKSEVTAELPTKRKSRKKKESVLVEPSTISTAELPLLSTTPVEIFPLEEIRIDNDALENHSNFTGGSDFLDHCTGYFETIGNLDLNFPSPETCEELWDDTFGICSDTEEEQNKVWLVDWKRSNPEEPQDTAESVAEIEKAVHPCDSKLEEKSICSKTKALTGNFENATSSRNTKVINSPVDSKANNLENPDSEIAKAHPIKPCFVLVEKLSSVNGSQDNELPNSGNMSLSTVNSHSEAESCASVCSNSMRSNSSQSLSGSEYCMDQGPVRKVGRKRKGKGRPPKKIQGDSSSKGGKRNSTCTSVVKKKSQPKSKQSSSDEDELEHSVQCTPKRQRRKSKPSPKTKRRSVRKGSKRRQSSSEDSEDSDASIQIIQLDDSDSDESHSEEPEESEDLPQTFGKSVDAKKEVITEPPPDEQKAEASWHKFAIADADEDVIDVSSDKEEDVDPLDVSHVGMGEEMEKPQNNVVLPDLLASGEHTEDLSESSCVQGEYPERLSVDSNSGRHVPTVNPSGESYIIVKNVGSNNIKLPGGDNASSGLLTVHLEGPKTEGIMLVSEENRNCTKNIHGTAESSGNEDELMKMIHDDEDILTQDEEETAILSELNIEDADSEYFSPEQDIFGVEHVRSGDMQGSTHGLLQGSENINPTEGIVADEEDEDEILNEDDIFVEPEEIVMEAPHSNHILPNVHVPNSKLPVVESTPGVVSETRCFPYHSGKNLEEIPIELQADDLVLSPENREGYIAEDDETEGTSEGTTETETDCEEHEENVSVEENCVAVGKVSPKFLKHAEEASCILRNTCSLDTGTNTPVKEAESSENIEQDHGTVIAPGDEDATPNITQKTITNSDVVSYQVQNLESAVLEQTGSYMTLPVVNELFQPICRESDRAVGPPSEVSGGESLCGDESLASRGKYSDFNAMFESNPNISAVVGDNIKVESLISVEETDSSKNQVVTELEHQELLPYTPTQSTSNSANTANNLLDVSTNQQANEQDNETTASSQSTSDVTSKQVENERIESISADNAELSELSKSELDAVDNYGVVANVASDLATDDAELPSFSDRFNETFDVSNETQTSVNQTSGRLPSFAPEMIISEKVIKARAPVPGQVKKYVSVTITTIFDCEHNVPQDNRLGNDSLHDPVKDLEPIPEVNRRNKFVYLKSQKSKTLQAPEDKRKDSAAIIAEHIRENQGSPDVNPLENQFDLQDDTTSRSNTCKLIYQSGETKYEVGTGNDSSHCLNTPSLDCTDSVQSDNADEKDCKASLSNTKSVHPGIDNNSGDCQEISYSSCLTEEEVEVKEEVSLVWNQTEENLLPTSQEITAEKEDNNIRSSSGHWAGTPANCNKYEGSREDWQTSSDGHQEFIDESYHYPQSSELPKQSSIFNAPLGPTSPGIQRSEGNQTGANAVALGLDDAGRGSSSVGLEEFEVKPFDSNTMDSSFAVRTDHNNGDSSTDQSSSMAAAVLSAPAITLNNLNAQPPRKIRHRLASTFGERKSQRVALNQKRKRDSKEEASNCEGEVVIINELRPLECVPAVPKEDELSDLSNFGNGDRGHTLEYKIKKRKGTAKVEKKFISKISISPDEEVARILQHKNGWDAKQPSDKKNKNTRKELAPALSQADLSNVITPNSKITSDTYPSDSIDTESSAEASQRIWTPCSEKMPDIGVEIYSGIASSPPTSVNLSLNTDKNVPSKSYRLRLRKVHGTSSIEAKDMYDSEENDGNGVAPVLSPEITRQLTELKEKPSVVIFEDKKQALSLEVTKTVSAPRRPKRVRTVNNTVDTKSCKRTKKDVMELEHSESPPILSKPEDNITLLSFGETENCKSPLPPILEPEV